MVTSFINTKDIFSIDFESLQFIKHVSVSYVRCLGHLRHEKKCPLLSIPLSLLGVSFHLGVLTIQPFQNKKSFEQNNNTLSVRFFHVSAFKYRVP